MHFVVLSFLDLYIWYNLTGVRNCEDQDLSFVDFRHNCSKLYFTNVNTDGYVMS